MLVYNNENKYFLAIDNGTQSIRAIVFDSHGNICDSARLLLEAYFSKQTGLAEQHAEYYWEKLCAVCHKLFAQGKVKPEQVSGISLTTQRYTMVCLSKDMQPLRPAIVWLDQREADVAQLNKFRPIRLLKPVVAAAGMSDIASQYQKKARDNWLAQHEPHIWKNTAYYVNLSAYLTYKLTGKLKDSAGQIVGYLPYNYKKFAWAGPLDVKWHLGSVTRQQLPSLVQPCELLGRISAQASVATGLPENLPLIAAASDKACEVLGSGCTKATEACLSFGTTATINTTTHQYTEVLPSIPAYTAAIPNHYNTEFMVYRGFWMVSWFKEQFARLEAKLAQQQDASIEKLLDKEAEQVPAGSLGLIFQPYFSPGVQHPGQEGRGALIGFNDGHTRAHVYRAILEGLIYELRHGLEVIEKQHKRKVTTLMVAGGGSQSNTAMQIAADVFNLTATRPHTFEASSLGAAICCSVGLGVYKDVHTAAQHMTRQGDSFSPISCNVKRYQALYDGVYSPMYHQLKPLYKRISRIIPM